MDIQQIRENDFRIVRAVRWIFFIPVMYGTAFMSGLMFIPSGEMGTSVAILVSALAGIAVAPRHRVWATAFSFFYGNYLYLTSVSDDFRGHYYYEDNYRELFVFYCQTLKAQAPLFALPTVLTLIAAVGMDHYSKGIEDERRKSHEIVSVESSAPSEGVH